MSLIDFINNHEFVVGWTDKDSYGLFVDNTIVINLHLFLARAAIHEYIHYSNPHTELGDSFCSEEIRRKTTKVVRSLSKSALMEIAETVNKSIVKNQRKSMEKALAKYKK